MGYKTESNKQTNKTKLIDTDDGMVVTRGKGLMKDKWSQIHGEVEDLI